jgi:hypothetical protein
MDLQHDLVSLSRKDIFVTSLKPYNVTFSHSYLFPCVEMKSDMQVTYEIRRDKRKTITALEKETDGPTQIGGAPTNLQVQNNTRFTSEASYALTMINAYPRTLQRSNGAN